MPKRRAKGSTKKRPLDFAESPLNARHDLPTPVHCSLYPPVTADIVPVEQIATSWVSPQFEGKLLRGETIGRRVRPPRQPPGGQRRAPSLDSSSLSTYRRFIDAEQGTRPRRRPTFRPLDFILNESSEVAKKSSDDVSTTSDDECDRVAERDDERRRRSAPLERTEGDVEERDGNKSLGNSFADIMLIGKHFDVQTPEDSQTTKDLLPSDVTVHETTASSLLEKDVTSKRSLSRRLFQPTTNGLEKISTSSSDEEELPSLENACQTATVLEARDVRLSNETTSSPLLEEDVTSKRNLSRRLFQPTTNRSENISTGALDERLPPSLENTCKRTMVMDTQVAPPRPNDVSLLHLSFESKDDSIIVGCLPRVDLLNGSAFFQPDSSFSQNDDTLDVSKTETFRAKKIQEPPNVGDKTTVLIHEPLLRLPCRILSSITRETPPHGAGVESTEVLVEETPVSYHGMTYRQKQLKGLL